MPSTIYKNLLAVLASTGAVSAHGYVRGIHIDGKLVEGYDPTKYPYMKDPPATFGWATDARDLGFVAPDAYGKRDIVCNRSSKNAKQSATVAAGSTVTVEWNTWPPGHDGPIINYLASCGAAGCATADATTLEFFKFAEAGLGGDGTWATQQLAADGLRWDVKIPAEIAPGEYVLRHEIIALHSGQNSNGAQNYPQCFNLEITGSGTAKPPGKKGTDLYRPEDKGIHFNLYWPKPTSYPIPGPAVYGGRRGGGGGGGGGPASPPPSKASSEPLSEPTRNTTTGTKNSNSPPKPTTTNESPTTTNKVPTDTYENPSNTETPTATGKPTGTEAPTSTASSGPDPTGDCPERKARRNARKMRRAAAAAGRY